MSIGCGLKQCTQNPKIHTFQYNMIHHTICTLAPYRLYRSKSIHPESLATISAAARLRSSCAAPFPRTDLFSIARRLRYGMTYDVGVRREGCVIREEPEPLSYDGSELTVTSAACLPPKGRHREYT